MGETSISRVKETNDEGFEVEVLMVATIHTVSLAIRALLTEKTVMQT